MQIEQELLAVTGRGESQKDELPLYDVAGAGEHVQLTGPCSYSGVLAGGWTRSTGAPQLNRALNSLLPAGSGTALQTEISWEVVLVGDHDPPRCARTLGVQHPSSGSNNTPNPQPDHPINQTPRRGGTSEAQQHQSPASPKLTPAGTGTGASAAEGMICN